MTARVWWGALAIGVAGACAEPAPGEPGLVTGVVSGFADPEARSFEGAWVLADVLAGAPGEEGALASTRAGPDGTFTIRLDPIPEGRAVLLLSSVRESDPLDRIPLFTVVGLEDGVIRSFVEDPRTREGTPSVVTLSGWTTAAAALFAGTPVDAELPAELEAIAAGLGHLDESSWDGYAASLPAALAAFVESRTPPLTATALGGLRPSAEGAAHRTLVRRLTTVSESVNDSLYTVNIPGGSGRAGPSQRRYHDLLAYGVGGSPDQPKLLSLDSELTWLRDSVVGPLEAHYHRVTHAQLGRPGAVPEGQLTSRAMRMCNFARIAEILSNRAIGNCQEHGQLAAFVAAAALPELRQVSYAALGHYPHNPNDRGVHYVALASDQPKDAPPEDGGVDLATVFSLPVDAAGCFDKLGGVAVGTLRTCPDGRPGIVPLNEKQAESLYFIDSHAIGETAPNGREFPAAGRFDAQYLSEYRAGYSLLTQNVLLLDPESRDPESAACRQAEGRPLRAAQAEPELAPGGEGAGTGHMLGDETQFPCEGCDGVCAAPCEPVPAEGGTMVCAPEVEEEAPPAPSPPPAVCCFGAASPTDPACFSDDASCGIELVETPIPSRHTSADYVGCEWRLQAYHGDELGEEPTILARGTVTASASEAGPDTCSTAELSGLPRTFLRRVPVRVPPGSGENVTLAYSYVIVGLTCHPDEVPVGDNGYIINPFPICESADEMIGTYTYASQLLEVAPESIGRGRAETITVRGRGLSRASRLSVCGTPITTEWVSTLELRGHIPEGALPNPGPCPITINRQDTWNAQELILTVR